MPITSPTVVTTGATISSGSKPLLNDINAVKTLINAITQMSKNPVNNRIATNSIKPISVK